MAKAKIGLHPGYEGLFTRDQADGALPNGTRIVKANSERGDAHPDGSLGTILGSFARPPDLTGRERADWAEIKFCYFVEFDAAPRVAIGTLDKKIRPAP